MPSLLHGRAAVAEASKHFVHAVTGRRAHRGVEGRLARELRVKVGRVVGCAEERAERRFCPALEDRLPVHTAEEAVPFNVFSVGGAEAEAALHAAGQQPLHQVLKQQRHILKISVPGFGSGFVMFLGLPRWISWTSV